MICIANAQSKICRQTEKAINIAIKVDDFSNVEWRERCKLALPETKRLFRWFPKSAIISREGDCVYLQDWASRIVEEIVAEANTYTLATGTGKTRNAAWADMETRQEANYRSAAKAFI